MLYTIKKCIIFPLYKGKKGIINNGMYVAYIEIRKFVKNRIKQSK